MDVFSKPTEALCRETDEITACISGSVRNTEILAERGQLILDDGTTSRKSAIARTEAKRTEGDQTGMLHLSVVRVLVHYSDDGTMVGVDDGFVGAHVGILDGTTVGVALGIFDGTFVGTPVVG